MANTEWYRQRRWTPQAATEFEARLSRSRGQRAEYLRIQALTLAGSGQKESAAPAIELALRYLSEEPSGIAAAQMYATIAQASATLHDPSAAIAAYRRAIEAERARPNIRGSVYIAFAWFAATEKLSSVYDEALAAMDTNMQPQDLVFPLTRYRYFGALALIASDRGDKDTAKRMARTAIESAGEERGPFKRYPLLGLVRTGRDANRARLEKLAG